MTITKIALGQANAFLLSGKEGGILVDTGPEKYRERVLEACRGQDVRLVFLTHGHFDHCQRAAGIAWSLGCPLALGREDIPLLAQGEKRQVFGRGFHGRLFAMASNHSIIHSKIEQTQPDVVLTDGMALEPYGVKGRVIALPGHTAGSMGLLLHSGELFAGDAMMNFFRPSLPWCYENFQEAGETVAKIRNIAPSKVYFGHGAPSAL